MTTKSQQPDNEKTDIYQLVEKLQNYPDHEPLQEEIIVRYKDLVASLAWKYSKSSSIHEDLTQVGMIGLLGAARRYDASQGRSFESFAVPTIIGEIKRYIRDKTWSVHVPRRIKELGPKIKKATEELTEKNQTPPTIPILAEYLNVSEEEVLETMEMSRSYKALSADRDTESDSEGGTVSILDVVGRGERGYEQVDQKILLEEILPVLTQTEQDILRCTYFKYMSQKETGEYLNISQMHVSRLQRRALRKLRDALYAEGEEVLD